MSADPNMMMATNASATVEPSPFRRYCPQCSTLFGREGQLCPHDGAPLRSMDSEGDEWTGQVLGGRLTVCERLGEGGMGWVYRAIQHPLGRPVAVKVLRTRDAPQALEAFLKEAVIVSRLNHANIITVHDFGVTDRKDFFLVMELLVGRTLRDVLRHTGKLPIPSALTLFGQMCAALHSAHSAGVVHCDFKPTNVMLLARKTPNEPVVLKVLDFGLAHAEKSVLPGQETPAGRVSGTPTYMAPEQVVGDPPDARTDVYSLALVLYEMLTGEPPFTGATARDVMRDQLLKPPPSLRAARPDVPEGVQAAIERALSKPASFRPASVEELWREIHAAVTPSRPPPLRAVPPSLPPLPPPQPAKAPEAPIDAMERLATKVQQDATAATSDVERARAELRLATLRVRQQRWAEATALAQQAAPTLRAEGETHECAVAQELLARVCRRTGDLEMAAEWSREAIASWRAASAWAQMAEALAESGMLAWQRGLLKQARADLAEAVKTERAIGRGDRAMEGLLRLGAVAVQDDAGALAEQHFMDALQMASVLALPEASARCYSHLGGLAVQRRRYPDACQWYERAIQQLKLAGDATGIARETLNLGAALLGTGDTRMARLTLGRALALGREAHDTRVQAGALRFAADAASRMSLWEEALRGYLEAEDLDPGHTGERLAAVRQARRKLKESGKKPEDVLTAPLLRILAGLEGG